MVKNKTEYCIGVCKKTKKIVLMVFDDEDGWICLHQDKREDELKDIINFINKYK